MLIVIAPASIKTAVLLMWTAFLLSIITSYARVNSSEPGFALPIIYLFMIVYFLLLALIVYQTSRGRNWARITYVVLTLLGWYGTIVEPIMSIKRAPVVGLLSIALIVLGLIAIILLFMPASNLWFKQS